MALTNEENLITTKGRGKGAEEYEKRREGGEHASGKGEMPV